MEHIQHVNEKPNYPSEQLSLQLSLPSRPLPPEIKAQWLADLRGGEYVQGSGKLRDGDSYCCLGVLCDQIDPGAWINGTWFNEAAYFPYTRLNMVNQISEQFIIGYDYNNNYISLANLNDGGFTFAQIADVIEYFF